MKVFGRPAWVSGVVGAAVAAAVLVLPGLAWPAPAVPPGQVSDCVRSVRVADVAQQEGSRGDPQPVTFRVESDGCLAGGLVRYETIESRVPEAATAGADYLPTAGDLQFDPGDPSSRTITVLVVPDQVPETNEVVQIQLCPDTLDITTNPTATATIVDDDGPRILPTPEPITGYGCQE